MSRRLRPGGVLFITLVSVVYSFSNDTLNPGIYAKTSGGSELWDVILRDCKNPSVTCIQKTIYRYLSNALDFTKSYEYGGIKFFKNNITYNSKQNEIEDDEEESREFRNPFERVTSTLHNKITKFVLTHDMQLQLPEMIFEGSSLQISPRKFDDTGLIAKLELLPRINNDVGAPRILIKKIKKFIGQKLMNALLSIVLVIALFSAKALFFLPAIVGVAAAKKVLIKILLFIFPFLSHFFKLCPFYDDHLGTKFHHHHHQISHLHHLPPPPPSHLKHPPFVPHHEKPNFEQVHVHDHEHDSDHFHGDPGLDYYADGPHYGYELISHRKTDPKQPDYGSEENEINSVGGGQGKETAKRGKKPQMNRPLTPAEIENLALKAEKEAVLKVRLQQEHQRVHAENKLLQEQIKQSLKMQEKLRLQASIMHQHKLAEAFQHNSLSATPGIPSQVLQLPPLTPTFPPPPFQTNQVQPTQPTYQVTQPSYQVQTQRNTFTVALQHAAAITYDSFYTPILEKIDAVLYEVGFDDEPCKERLICSMYKDPNRFSPHSNLLSAQLSRDASELQKPTATNAAVIRFYRYVQAARDGQDKRECLRLYPSCAINTEL